MNQDLIIKCLHEWMVDFIEKPNPLLSNWPPCPYARQARINNRIEIRFSETHELTRSVDDCLLSLDDKDVVIICFDHRKIIPTDLQELVKDINEFIMPNNYIVLEDHPDAIEFVNGVNMNFKECGLLLVQKRDKLRDASEQLKAKGYYDVWSKQELDDVVNWR